MAIVPAGWVLCDCLSGLHHAQDSPGQAGDQKSSLSGA